MVNEKGLNFTVIEVDDYIYKIIQKNAEIWIREHLNKQHRQSFSESNVELEWGGKFKFDAVSQDGEIIGCISTSPALTAKGKQATGKIQKIKCDTLYLLHSKNVQKRILIFTEKSMKQHFEKDRDGGRFPKDIELTFVELPKNIQTEIEESRRKASEEVSPKTSQ